MRKVELKVFDDIVGSAATAWTRFQLDPILAAYDQIALQVIVDNVSAAGQIRVQLEISGDRRDWTNKQTSPEVSASFGAGVTTRLFGYDNGATPSMPFGRLSIGVITAARAHVVIWATLRDHAFRPRAIFALPKKDVTDLLEKKPLLSWPFGPPTIQAYNPLWDVILEHLHRDEKKPGPGGAGGGDAGPGDPGPDGDYGDAGMGGASDDYDDNESAPDPNPQGVHHKAPPTGGGGMPPGWQGPGDDPEGPPGPGHLHHGDVLDGPVGDLAPGEEVWIKNETTGELEGWLGPNKEDEEEQKAAPQAPSSDNQDAGVDAESKGAPVGAPPGPGEGGDPGGDSPQTGHAAHEHGLGDGDSQHGSDVGQSAGTTSGGPGPGGSGHGPGGHGGQGPGHSGGGVPGGGLPGGLPVGGGSVPGSNRTSPAEDVLQPPGQAAPSRHVALPGSGDMPSGWYNDDVTVAPQAPAPAYAPGPQDFVPAHFIEVEEAPPPKDEAGRPLNPPRPKPRNPAPPAPLPPVPPPPPEPPAPIAVPPPPPPLPELPSSVKPADPTPPEVPAPLPPPPPPGPPIRTGTTTVDEPVIPFTVDDALQMQREEQLQETMRQLPQAALGVSAYELWRQRQELLNNLRNNPLRSGAKMGERILELVDPLGPLGHAFELGEDAADIKDDWERGDHAAATKEAYDWLKRLKELIASLIAVFAGVIEEEGEPETEAGGTGQSSRRTGTAQGPNRRFRDNVGGPRQISELKQVLKQYGVEVPANVEFYPNPNLPPDVLMEYGTTRRVATGEPVEWFGDIVTEIGSGDEAHEVIRINVNPNVLGSDEAIVAGVVHELFEITHLEALMEERGGSLPEAEFNRLVKPGNERNLHGRAWDAANSALDSIFGPAKKP